MQREDPVSVNTASSGEFSRGGLSAAEAARLLTQHGANELPAVRRQPWWLRTVRQLQSPIIYILLFALFFDLATWVFEGANAWPIESLAIFVILAFNTVMGVWQEYRAEDALARLNALAAPTAWVRRGGELLKIPAAALVPGDLARVESGDRIPADGVIEWGQGLLVDESMLTGESVPVDRAVGEEVFSGTISVRGLAWLTVTRTGSASAMGKIAGLLAGVEAESTPLERRLTHFGHRVAQWVAALAVVLVVAGVGLEGIDRLDEVLLFAVAVAVAAVPEGLPAVLTLTLALGTERMASRQAVVRRLAAVEALGSVTVVATDKTGTLTENKMIVRSLDSPDPERALLAMALAADAEPDSESGDPIEIGLYRYAAGQGLDPATARTRCKRVSERPFDPAWKYMRATVRDEAGDCNSYLKGAPEVLLERCGMSPDEKADWLGRIESAAEAGNRVLGLAWAPSETEESLNWLGIVGLWDPPRPEVADAIRQTRQAGIRVLMITGDHPGTARAIAKAIGIESTGVMTGIELESADPATLAQLVGDVSVFARVSPEHKLALVEALQAQGEIVAMTGDGVNDAPALKRANIGIAMGQRGSDVTREVADLILLDDNFATITAAIEEGRSIYVNILKFIRFLFSTNAALVLLVAVGVTGAALIDLRDEAGNLLVPLLAVQLLWINVLADGPPALALGLDRNPGVLGQLPRAPSAPLIAAADANFILAAGGIKAVFGLALFFALPVFGYVGSITQTAVFVYESLAQLAFAYPSRRLTGTPAPNRVLNIIVVLGVLLSILTITLPPLRVALGLVSLPAEVIAAVAAALLLTVFGAEFWSRRAVPARKD
ncbi:MAG: cation-translocating P-type ATPase [Gammaproteobacteria bacterium]|nr:cation-translocating P-type ATPase [Gammaproteobacteria bacterium]